MKKALLIVLSVLVTATLFARGAAEQETVVVYSPHGDEIMTAVADRFESETGIKVEFLTGGGGELADRIRAEAANPQADVFYGNPSSVFSEMGGQGLFETYTPSWAAELQPFFKDPAGYWFGTIQTPVVLFYNKDMLSAADAPKDWLDLVQPKYRNQIIFRSTTSAASRAWHAAMMEQFDRRGVLQTEGWNAFRGLDRNVKRYVSDSSLMFQAIARQEAAIGFWTLSGVTTNIRDNNMPLEIVDATSGSPVITDAIAIVANAKHLDAAKAFVEFAGRPDVQSMLANDFGRMPTHPDALRDAPDWMASFTYRIMDVDWKRLAEKQSEWIQYYEDSIRSAAKVAD